METMVSETLPHLPFSVNLTDEGDSRTRTIRASGVSIDGDWFENNVHIACRRRQDRSVCLHSPDGTMVTTDFFALDRFSEGSLQ